MSDNKKRKTMVSVLFMEFSIIFTVCLIASNILETKQMVFGPLHLTGGSLKDYGVGSSDHFSN